MKRFFLVGCLVVGFTVFLRAQEPSFTQSVSSADAAEAGIGNLTPNQRAKLDLLIAQYQSGALAAARQAAQAAAQGQAAAEARAIASAEQARLAADQAKAAAEQAKVAAAATLAAEAQAAEEKKNAAEEKKKSASFLARAKALITPGTKIEYAPVEAHIVGSIGGWGPDTVFLLDNGQRWKVADFTHYINGGNVANPAVTIKPAGLMGGFELHIEGMGGMRVRLLNGTTYKAE